MDLCEITRQLWEDYLIVRTPESLTRAMNRLAPDCVLIGTGKHEFYLSRERMQQALEVEVEQTRGCRFYIVDEWCQEMPLTEDVRLVYGGLRVRDAELSKPALVDMDSRYTLVYTRQGEDWVVRHGHQSLPYTEQAAGESYPRTLIEQVKEARHLADRMTRLAQKDPVTGLYNHRGFFDEANVRLAEGPGCFMVLDLDDFKQINDTYGHITGDDILRQTGDVLCSATRSVDVVGRIGGDEYAIFCPGVTQEAVALAIARRIIRHVNAAAGISVGCTVRLSIGIAVSGTETDTRPLFEKADRALYKVKRSGKNSCCLYMPQDDPTPPQPEAAQDRPVQP